MKCKLCQQRAEIREKISNKSLSTQYKKQLNIQISLPKEDIGLYHCHSCDYLFFSSHDNKDISGDNSFYNELNQLPWYYFNEKYEYEYAKQFINPNDKVLEVGCGKAAFAKYISKACYKGLELSTNAKKMAQENGIIIENSSIQAYAHSHPNSVDFVCSFQVLEHINNPQLFIQSKIDACKVGGHIFIAIPSQESFIQYAINNILNMPPHHIGRFSDKCLRNIAKIFGIKLIDLHHEKIQPEHVNFYKSVMFSKKIFTPKLLSSNPMIKVANKLGRFFEEIPHNAYGHTVMALYQKI